MSSLSNPDPKICGIGNTPNWWTGSTKNSSDVKITARYPRIIRQTPLTASLSTTGTSGKEMFERDHLRTKPTDMDIFQIQEIELSEAEAEELDRLSRETRENGVSWESLKAKLGL